MPSPLLLFNEFPQKPEEMTDELRHQKRVKLEPLIFDSLKQKYFSQLKKAFQTYKAPDASEHAIIIIEGRIHPNLEFLIYNAAYFGKGWRIIVCCSDLSRPWLESVLGSQASQVEFREVFKGSADREKGRDEYNVLMRSPGFYKSFSQNYLFFMETDCYIRKVLPIDAWKPYDYIASPASWDESILIGGASYRRRDAIIQVCSEYPSETWAHDVFIDEGTRALSLKRPSFEQALQWFTESCHYEDPVTVHQWWTFFFQDCEDAELICSSLLQLDIG